jgi:lipoprotein NlpI
MSKKTKSTDLRVELPSDLKERIRRFRAEKLLQGTAISSDAKAILHLAELGLQYNTLGL